MDNNAYQQVFPKEATPYYIVALPYTRFSAGVKALHLLCHHLNQRGHSASILPLSDTSVLQRVDFCNPELLTPLLTLALARQHYEDARTPIIIYPEIVSGAPFGGACVVRYVLNYPGLLGGDKTFDQDDLCFSYSKILGQHTNNPENILFIPASDEHVFHPPTTESKRSGTCFYASKYQKTHKGKLFDITKESLEITSGLPGSQSPEEIAEIFRKSELFYTYENTALAIEATLCGCPAVFLPNEHLQSIIASEELGTDGIAWGAAPEEVAHAKESVKEAFKNYTRCIEKFYEDLDVFIAKTQSHAKQKEYSSDNYQMLLSHLIKFSALEWKDQNYVSILKKLPWQIEKQVGALLCSLGRKEDGEFLWNRAERRAKIKKN
jgi:hypothetical protein